MLGLGLSQRQTITTEQRLRLSLKQYQKIAFGEFVSTPDAVCPECEHELSEKEIIAGFSDDPHDFETTCPKCKKRFLAHLMIEYKDGSRKAEKVIYLCQSQTLYAMKSIKKKRGRIGITYLGEHNRQLFFNIIRHWVTYEKGLKVLNKYMK